VKDLKEEVRREGENAHSRIQSRMSFRLFCQLTHSLLKLKLSNLRLTLREIKNGYVKFSLYDHKWI